MNITKLQELNQDSRDIATEGSASGCAHQLLQNIVWLVENEKDDEKRKLMKWMIPMASHLVGFIENK